ncbi:MAG TPA: type IV secretion system protein [Candidatus Omnitrophota bacterium]|nr:type IV secretion system protein [Candidatus Omnitrophota bacterium]
MDFIIGVINSDLAGIIQLGQFLLGGFFVLACFVTYLGVFQNKANWSGLIVRLVIGFFLLQNYILVMETTRDIVAGIDLKISPDQNATNQYVNMCENMQKIYEDNQQKGFSLAVFGTKTLHNFTINLSFIFYSIVSNVMDSVRTAIVAIIYKLGPILMPLILFDSTKKILQGWFTSYVSVLSWPILWHVVLTITVALSGQISPTLDGIEKFAMMNFAVCFVLIYSPLIVSGLVAGIGVGAAASLASMGAVNKVSEGVRGSSRIAGGGVAQGLEGVAGALVTHNYLKILPMALGGGIKGMADKAGIHLSEGEKSTFQAIKNMMSSKKGGVK